MAIGLLNKEAISVFENAQTPSELDRYESLVNWVCAWIHSSSAAFIL